MDKGLNESSITDQLALVGTDMVVQSRRDGLVCLVYCDEEDFLLAPFELDAICAWWAVHRDRMKKRWEEKDARDTKNSESA